VSPNLISEGRVVVNVSVVLLALLVLGGALFAVPLAGAFLRGLASARDPLHRVTPVSPWQFFRRAFLRRLRWPAVVWALVMVVLFFLGQVGWYTEDWYSTSLRIHAGSNLPAIALGACLLMATFGILWAPWCTQRWTLVALILFPALVSYALLLLALRSVLPAGWRTVRYPIVRPSGNPVSAHMPLEPHYIVLIGLLTLALAILWARQRGERWFRFEE
jgi:hypothetical protein